MDDLRQVIDVKGADLVAALGERGDDVSARIVGSASARRIRSTSRWPASPLF